MPSKFFLLVCALRTQGLAGRSLPLETTNAKAVAAPSAPMIKGVALVLPWWSELVRGFGPLCRPAG
jgi:hypothetical protein